MASPKTNRLAGKMLVQRRQVSDEETSSYDHEAVTPVLSPCLRRLYDTDQDARDVKPNQKLVDYDPSPSE